MQFFFSVVVLYRINMSMPGLPPLPKSLSGFELAAAQQQLQHGLTAITEQAAAAAAAVQQQGSNHHQHQQMSGGDGLQQQQQNLGQMPRRQSSTLDNQLSILRREMVRIAFSLITKWGVFLLHFKGEFNCRCGVDGEIKIAC